MATLYRILPSWGVPSRCAAYTVRDSNGQQSPLPRLLIAEIWEVDELVTDDELEAEAAGAELLRT